jgi:ATP-dependent DNA helicase RecG
MVRLSDEALLALLENVESDRSERKQSLNGDAREKIAQAICAFANDLPDHRLPGVVIVGADDNGRPVGAEITDQLLQTLADIKSNGQILPPPSLTVEKRTLRGSEMAVVTVLPADSPPVRYQGRIWIRVGPRRGLATAQDERLLNEKRRHRDRPFDIHPIAGSSVSDLSRSAFEIDYLPNAVAADVLEANERSHEERLASLGMIASVDQPVPTVTGLLTLGIAPRNWLPCSYVQFLRIRGAHLADPILDEQEIDGTLDQILRRLDEKIRAHLATSVDFTSGSVTEVRRQPYPLAALQQLTRNAVMHRSYENTHAPVRLHWFDDRIEITSPGGPYGVVTAANFGQPGVSDYRNPNVASVMKTLGFVQRFGSGIAVARRTMAENGNPPPEFQVEQTLVHCRLRSAQ